MLQLSFKKFDLETGGLRGVTHVNAKELHPMRLYQGVVRKYDARLFQEWDRLDEIKEDEENYCRGFFARYKCTSNLIRAIIEYKDAYSLKEVVGHLLYDPEYFIKGFLTTELSRRGRISF